MSTVLRLGFGSGTTELGNNTSHSDPNAPEYNKYDIGPRGWCENAKELLKDVV